MSTRKGNVVFLEEVLNKAVKLAGEIIDEKNPHLRNKEEVAEAVGVGAIIFNDLKSGRIRDITFNWDEMLNFNGETGPYLQYTYARIQSLLNKYRETYGQIGFDDGLPFGEEGYELALTLNNFDTAVSRAAQEFEPSVISRYLLDLASQFNSFYNAHRVVSDDRELSLARVLLVQTAGDVLSRGLSLLGVKSIDEM
jgi:arginyl-tRNA synthetase